MSDDKKATGRKPNLYVILKAETLKGLHDFFYETTGDSRVRSSVIERYIIEGMARDRALGLSPMDSHMARLKAEAGGRGAGAA